MNTEKCFEKIGATNRWIVQWFLILSLAKSLPSVFSMFSFQFTSVLPKKFHCKLNVSDQLLNFTLENYIPKELGSDGKYGYSNCRQYYNASSIKSSVPCLQGYSYQLDYFYSSIVTDWDLVCDRAWLNSIATSSFFVMSFIGSIISCSISDRYGRKIVFLTSFTCLNVGQLLLGLSPNIYFHIVFKLCTGIFQQGCFVTGFTMILELFSVKNRANACLFDTFSWTFASIALVGMAYFLSGLSWRWFFITTALVTNICFGFLYFTLPESIRWLISQNRFEEANGILAKAGQYCKPKLTEKDFSEINQSVDLSKRDNHIPLYNILDIFKNSLLRRYQIINTFVWFTAAMTFYGLQVKVVEIGNPFLTFLLSSLVEIPANFFVYPLANKYGRKCVMSLFCLTVSLFTISGALALFFISNVWPAICLFLVGKMINTGQFNMVFMHVGEMFPTTLRSTAIGMSSSSARLGASVGAILFQVNGGHVWFPFIFAFVANIGCGILIFCLPETYKRNMPDTIEEVEEWNRNKPFISFR